MRGRQLALRYARRTLRLTVAVGRVAITLAGRAGAAMLTGLGVPISRSTMSRVLVALPIPSAPRPTVLGVDDVALRRGHRYATVIIDALTHRRDRCAARPPGGHVAAWLGEHSGAEVVCRDGSAAYAEAHPRRCRSATTGTCGTWAQQWRRASSPTTPAGAHSHRRRRRRRCRFGDQQGPCTNCSARAWDCCNAPGGWAGC